MPFVEQTEHRPPISETNPKVGNLERKKSGQFELQPTHIEGVFLKVLEGEEVEISKGGIRTFYRAGQKFTEADFEGKKLDGERDLRRKTIVAIAEECKNLRGMTVEKEGWEITITPLVRRKWNQAVLEKSLELLYPALIREVYSATINIPQGAVTITGEVIDRNKVSMAMHQGLTELGLSEADISQIMNEEISMRLDEESLNKAIEEGRVTIPPEAVEEKITWQVKASKLKKF